MTTHESVPLSSLTTLRAGGPARIVAFCESAADVRAALALSKERGLPYYVLGEGSNVLAPDEGFEGVVLRMQTDGLTVTDEGSVTHLHAGAGVSWDRAVREAAARGLWGIENLAGIPGTCGAAPVQNIGAYGAELSQVLVAVDVLDATSGDERRLAAAECALRYRDSLFKHDQTLIILGMTLALAREGSARADYSDLKKAKEAGADLSTPEKVGELVRAIRSKKFPDLAVSGTAGSFFKNPIITEAEYAALAERYGEAPRFPNPDGVKIPLAFILDKVLGLRGFRLGRAHLFGAQPLVLVLDEGGTSADIEALAREVEKRVFDATNIRIEREVRSLA